MEISTKLSAIILLISVVVILAKPLEEINYQKDTEPSQKGIFQEVIDSRHVEKRSLDDQNDDVVPARFENAFVGPHRIRVLPGFLH